MPFTPLHMGPGLLIKGLLQTGFSLMVFGWAQIVMDLQPLVAILTGEGKLHGFSHTYGGATLLSVFAAVSGKYLGQLGLYLLKVWAPERVQIRWPIALFSAVVGTYSHVLIDSVMHADMEPFFPAWAANPLLGVISIDTLHKVCLYTGLFGLVLYGVGMLRYKRLKAEAEAG